MNLNEASQMIHRYFKDPRPDQICELFNMIAANGILNDMRAAGPFASVIDCFAKSHEDLNAPYAALIKHARSQIERLEALDRPGYNDVLIARWFINHDEVAVAELLSRCTREDPVGMSAGWALNNISQTDEDLRKLIISMTTVAQDVN